MELQKLDKNILRIWVQEMLVAAMMIMVMMMARMLVMMMVPRWWCQRIRCSSSSIFQPPSGGVKIGKAMIWSSWLTSFFIRYGSSPPYYYTSARKDIGRYTFHLLFENGTVAHFMKWKEDGIKRGEGVYYYPRKSTLHGDQDKTFSFCTVSLNNTKNHNWGRLFNLSESFETEN